MRGITQSCYIGHMTSVNSNVYKYSGRQLPIPFSFTNGGAKAQKRRSGLSKITQKQKSRARNSNQACQTANLMGHSHPPCEEGGG